MTTLKDELRWKLIDRLRAKVNTYYNPKMDGDHTERSQALTMLETYAKSLSTESGKENECTGAAYRIFLALRTGDLEPIAKKLVE